MNSLREAAIKERDAAIAEAYKHWGSLITDEMKQTRPLMASREEKDASLKYLTRARDAGWNINLINFALQKEAHPDAILQALNMSNLG
jgi:hypothetical protein